MNDIQKQAIEKIKKESAEFKGDKYGNVVAAPTAEALEKFCEQSEDFAVAVLNADKRFSECISSVVKGVKASISDLEVYQKAVRFYFPKADIKFDMRIILPGDVDKPVETVENSPEQTAVSGENQIISLFDIL